MTRLQTSSKHGALSLMRGCCNSIEGHHRSSPSLPLCGLHIFRLVRHFGSPLFNHLHPASHITPPSPTGNSKKPTNRRWTETAGAQFLSDKPLTLSGRHRPLAFLLPPLATTVDYYSTVWRVCLLTLGSYACALYVNITCRLVYV